MRIWKRSYNPFTFGGSCYRNIATNLPDNTKLYDLGMGFKGVLIEHSGKTYVFESKSGGLVGDTLEEVRKDIRSCKDVSIMTKQVMMAEAEGRKAIEVDYDEFFRN